MTLLFVKNENHLLLVAATSKLKVVLYHKLFRPSGHAGPSSTFNTHAGVLSWRWLTSTSASSSLFIWGESEAGFDAPTLGPSGRRRWFQEPAGGALASWRERLTPSNVHFTKLPTTTATNTHKLLGSAAVIPSFFE